MTPQYIWARGRCKLCAYKLEKPKNIAKMSVKRSLENKEYLKVRLEYLNENQVCEVKTPACTRWATTVHHKRGRTGDLLTNRDHFLGACFTCHSYIEENPDWAKRHGLSESRLSTNPPEPEAE